MNGTKKIFAKLKSVKNIEIYAAVVLALVVLVVVLFSNFSAKSVNENSNGQSYMEDLEHKIVNVVQKINGVGKVVVAITHDDAAESVFAYDEDGNSIIYVKGQPVIVKTLPPKILGVVVVAEGANDPIIRMKIQEAVVTLLDIDMSKVQVFTHKS